MKNYSATFCCKGKMTHSAVSKKPDQRAKKPLDMVHSDLAGPITPTAKDGFVYAIVFVDDYSGMTFHYFLKNKSDATRAMETFIADVASIGKIRVLRTDGGGEYMSNFKDVLIKHGIKHQLSFPHTHPAKRYCRKELAYRIRHGKMPLIAKWST